ncbi:MAG: putative DNA modification/repair radical SAM protein [Coriobacteriales bacterium]|jgi:putative DNA modification/repair radical SAM protein
METAKKLEILTDAAKYDVACTSSGVDRDAQLGHLGSTLCAGICHSFSADGRCITLLKVLMTNVCSYDCAYCANRRSNDIPRAAFEPRELADLTIQFYKRNYIEGLFLSSGILRSPDYTMEQMYRAIDILRNEYGFLGYIHVKTIPGASSDLIRKLGFLVDRMSVNIELPSSGSLKLMAPNKDKDEILRPMGFISRGIEQNPKGKPKHRLTESGEKVSNGNSRLVTRGERTEIARNDYSERFVPAGQSTQLIVGATPESDYQILRLSSALYRKYSLKRVFFSAYLPINDSSILPDKSTEVPLNREHRLYQADWLMRFYGFEFDEIVDAQTGFLDARLDPKASWALRNLDKFPVEINKAPYEMLLRVPGLGVRGAKKVMRARRHSKITPESMRKMGLSIKKIKYFVTFDGKYISNIALDGEAISKELILDANPARKDRRSGGKRGAEGQLSLFDPNDFSNITPENPIGEDGCERMLEPFQPSQLEAFANQRLQLERIKAKEKTLNRSGNVSNR